jgi:hypothetical protein
MKANRETKTNIELDQKYKPLTAEEMAAMEREMPTKLAVVNALRAIEVEALKAMVCEPEKLRWHLRNIESIARHMHASPTKATI